MTSSDLGRCPACHQWIQLPAFALSTQLVCPWCDRPIDVEQVERVPVRMAVAAHALVPQDVTELGNGDEIHAETGNAEMSEEVRSPFQVEPVRVRPRSTVTVGRTGVELAKIVAGGLAGLVVAQLMLWWIPGLGRRDPLGLAEHLPPWLNVLLPPELQPGPPFPQPRTNRPLPPPLLDEPPLDQLPPDEPPPDEPILDEPPPDERHLNELPLDEPILDEPPAIDPPADDVAPTDANIRSTGGTADEGNMVTEAAPHVADDAASNVQVDQEFLAQRSFAPVNAPTYSGGELHESLAHVVTALDRLEEASGAARDERMGLARDLYQRLCDMAQIASFVDVDDPRLGERMNAVDTLLVRIARNHSLLQLVGRTSAGWISLPARTSDGIALVGEVVRIESTGHYWESELQLLSKPGATIRVVSDLPPLLDPRMPYRLGSRLIVLGSVVSDPAVELPAYPGQGPVVWRGIHREIESTDDLAPAATDAPRTPAPARF